MKACHYKNEDTQLLPRTGYGPLPPLAALVWATAVEVGSVLPNRASTAC